MDKRSTIAAAVIGVAALAATACSSGGGSSSSTSSASSSSASGSASATGSSTGAALSGDCAQFSAYAGAKGTVTIFGSIISPESNSLQKSWAQFEKCTGITINYTGSNTFESDLPVKVNGGNPPDLALIPQPGLLTQMVLAGAVKAPPAQTVANEANWNQYWKNYGTVGGTFYAAPMSANMKSLVWYSPKFFAANHYTVPTTWAQLMSLSAKIAAAGKAKPWCGGINSGTASGWPATDWLEEVVLGKYGAQVYANWISHKIKFASPQIEDAMTIVHNWMQNPAWVNGGYGGVSSIATTTFQNAGAPILKNQCAMLQQASFYEAQWPSGTKVGPNGDVFAFKLPAVNPQIPTPVEGGGEFVTAFSSDPATQAVQNYLSTPQWADSRIKVAPGWVSANQKVNQALYTDPIDQLSAKYLADPNATFAFDASDAMPAAVGAGQEWKSMVAWFSNPSTPVATIASQIDAAWPSS
jgi:alpha-glucoside transport system substrate-binding protein